MKKTKTLLLIFAVAAPALSGCQYDGGGEGQRCNSQGVCSEGLICDQSQTPPRCVKPGNPDGGPDASTDAGDGGAGDTGVSDSGITLSPISPANPYVSVSKAVQLSATVEGSPNKKIDWRVTSGDGTISEDGLFTAPSHIGDATIKATAYADPAQFSTTTARVIALPYISSFTAAKSSLLYGETTTVTATFVNGNAILTPGDIPLSNDSPQNVAPVEDTEYKVMVTNQAGDKVEKTLTIVVEKVEIAITPPDAYVTAGHVKQFYATVSGALDKDVDWSIDSGGGTIDPFGKLTAPGATGIVTIRATSKAKTSVYKTAAVSVVEPAKITSFDTLKTPVKYGESSILKGVFEGGTGEIDNGIGEVDSGEEKTVSPFVTTVYKLTVTNAAGDPVEKTATVEVEDVAVAVSPKEIGLTVKTGMKFTAVVTGAVDERVSWKASLGDIDNDGNFVAPDAPGAEVTITATSIADPVKSDTALVHVVSGPAIQSFRADKPVVTIGNGANLKPVFTGGTGTINGTPVSSGDSFPTGNLNIDTKYTLVVTNGNPEKDAKEELTVRVVEAPKILSFAAAKPLVTIGYPTTVKGVFTGGTGDVRPGVGTVTSNQDKSTGPVNIKTTFVLTVTNEAQDTDSAEDVVDVVPAPDATVTAPDYVTAGKAGYKASVKDQANSSYSWKIDGGIITDGALKREVIFIVTGAAGGKVILTCTVTNQAGTDDTKSGTSEIVAPPQITGFTADPDQIRVNTSAKITPVFNNGEGSIGGIGPVKSEAAVTTPALSADTTYRLTVENKAKDTAIQDLTITVYKLCTASKLPGDITVKQPWLSAASSSDGLKLAAVSEWGYIYTSADGGATWKARVLAGKRNWASIVSSTDGLKLAAGSKDDSVFTSTDGGETWAQRFGSGYSYGVASSGDGTKLASLLDDFSVRISLNGGTDWSPSGGPAGDLITWTANGNMLFMRSDFSGQTGYLYKSANNGTSWAECTNAGKNDWSAIAASSSGSTLAAAVRNGYIYLSANSGTDWSQLTTAGTGNWTSISLSSDGTVISASTSEGYIFTSIDSGGTWTPRIGAGPRKWRSVASSADGSRVAAAAYGDYIYTSTALPTWEKRTGSGSRLFNTIASSSDGTKLVTTASNGYIYTSADRGATWAERSGPGNRGWSSISSSADGKKLVATVSSGDIWTSADSGATWADRTTSGSRNWKAAASSADGAKLAAVDSGTLGGYIYTSIDSGQNWTTRTTSGSKVWTSIASSADGKKLVAGEGNALMPGHLFLSGDSGATWVQSSSPAKIWGSVASSTDGSNLAAASSNGYICTSKDSGATWIERTGGGSREWTGVAISSDGRIIAGSVSGPSYIYISTDGGDSWTRMTGTPKLNWEAIAMSADGARMAAAPQSDYIYTFSDEWTARKNAATKNVAAVTISQDASTMATMVENDYIYLSHNSGMSWLQATAARSCKWGSIASAKDCTFIFAVGPGCTSMKTSDCGATWVSFANSENLAKSITTDAEGSKLAAISAPGQSRYSVDGGQSWAGYTYSSRACVWSPEGNYLLDGKYFGYIFMTENNGGKWTRLDNAGEHNWQSIATSYDGTLILAAPDNGYLYTSWDGGLTWTERTGAGARTWMGVAVSKEGAVMAVAEFGGVIWMSTDGGETWRKRWTTQETDLNYWMSIAITHDGSKVVATCDDDRQAVYLCW